METDINYTKRLNKGTAIIIYSYIIWGAISILFASVPYIQPLWALTASVGALLVMNVVMFKLLNRIEKKYTLK